LENVHVSFLDTDRTSDLHLRLGMARAKATTFGMETTEPKINSNFKLVHIRHDVFGHEKR